MSKAEFEALMRLIEAKAEYAVQYYDNRDTTYEWLTVHKLSEEFIEKYVNE